MKQDVKQFVDFLWCKFDKDNDGSLDTEEAWELVQQLYENLEFQCMRDDILNDIDLNKDGMVTKEEFLAYFCSSED